MPTLNQPGQRIQEAAMLPHRVAAVTTRKAQIYRIRLDRPHLDLLVRAATDQFQHHQVTICSERNDTVFTGSTFVDLIANIENSVECGDPKRLSDLHIECRNGSRLVRVDIVRSGAMVTVSDHDPAWATGKTQRLRELLLDTGGTSRPMRAGRAVCALMAAGAALVVGTALLALASDTSADTLSLLLTGGCVILAGLAGYLAGRRRERSSESQLLVGGPMPLTRWWDRAMPMEKLMAASTLIAFFTLLTKVIGR